MFKAAVSPDGHLRLPERSFLFSKIIFFTSVEQSLKRIELLSKRKSVISEQTKSLSKPRKDGFIAALNLLTSSSSFCLFAQVGYFDAFPVHTLFYACLACL